MLCVGSELLRCGGTLGLQSSLECNLHVGDGSGGREGRGGEGIIGGGEKRRHKEGGGDRVKAQIGGLQDWKPAVNARGPTVALAEFQSTL